MWYNEELIRAMLVVVVVEQLRDRAYAARTFLQLANVKSI